MKKFIYQWHRRLSIIIAIPILLWASSGFMHPLMTNIRPAIATQGWPPVVIDTSRIHISLPVALSRHHIDSIASFRLVHIDTNWFYQVVLPASRRTATTSVPVSPAIQPVTPVYVSCMNGNILPAGDWLYAQYLARHFLEGSATPAANHTATEHDAFANEPSPGQTAAPQASSHSLPAHVLSSTGLATSALTASPAPAETHDCCGAATECVLNPSRGAKVANVSMLSAYDNEYKSINRLLPVYRVSFNRPDGIRVYVETTQDRFSFAMDNKRAVFDEIFRLFHTWGWLDFLGKGRLAVEMTIALLAFLTALMGIYIFFSTRSKAVKNNSLVRARRNHRYTAIVASLFTLLWTFSGSYHAFSKFTDDIRDRYAANDHFAANCITPDYGRLLAAVHRPIVNLGIVKIDNQSYWQVYTLPATSSAHKDLMKDGKVALPPVTYIGTTDYAVLENGDERYAGWLATQFSGQPKQTILATTPVTSFGDEYNFTDKRLPVWKVSYATNGHQRWYIETSTGRLSSRVDDRIMAEGYSFSVFHKHHFMDWGGKSVRDLSTMVWALAQVLLVVIGLVLWIRSQRRGASRPITRTAPPRTL